MTGYVGRYHRVRKWSYCGLSAPYVLDRTRHTLQPYTNEEWWQHPSGMWLPVLAGGIGFRGLAQSPHLRLGFRSLAAAGSQTTLALDGAYTVGSSGDAIAGRLLLPGTRTLNNIYFFITGYTGTAADVDHLNWEIRTGTGTGPGTTAPDLVASGSIDPAAATGWMNISGLSQSLTGGTRYWIIIADTLVDVGGAFATVLRHHLGAYGDFEAAGLAHWASAQTTNGFATTAVSSGLTSMVLRFSDNLSWGQPLTSLAAASSNSNRKGLRLDGLTEALQLYGWLALSHAAINGGQIFSGTTGPGGTAEAIGTVYVVQEGLNIDNGVLFASPFTLQKNTPYRTVFTGSGAFISPMKASIGTGADANLREAMQGGGGWYYAEANGTTDWSNDDTNAFPIIEWLIEDQVAVAAGGGGPLVSGRLVD